MCRIECSSGGNATKKKRIDRRTGIALFLRESTSLGGQSIAKEFIGGTFGNAQKEGTFNVSQLVLIIAYINGLLYFLIIFLQLSEDEYGKTLFEMGQMLKEGKTASEAIEKLQPGVGPNVHVALKSKSTKK
jgi:hypothetical protein